jgi:hypothetical protein
MDLDDGVVEGLSQHGMHVADNRNGGVRPDGSRGLVVWSTSGLDGPRRTVCDHAASDRSANKESGGGQD